MGSTPSFIINYMNSDIRMYQKILRRQKRCDSLTRIKPPISTNHEVLFKSKTSRDFSLPFFTNWFLTTCYFSMQSSSTVVLFFLRSFPSSAENGITEVVTRWIFSISFLHWNLHYFCNNYSPLSFFYKTHLWQFLIHTLSFLE